MIEELLTPRLTGFAPPPASTTAEYFMHIGECRDCRVHPNGLCEEGEVLLDQAATIPAVD